MNEPTLFEEITGLQADPGHRPKREYRTGRQRRDAGIELVNANSSGEFAAVCQEAIDYLADKGEPFTVNDVRDLVVLEPHHVNAWGGQINAAVKAGRIRRVGFTESDRPEAHARVIRVYEGAK